MEKVKIINSVATVMFEVLLNHDYIKLLTWRKLIKRHMKSVKKVPIGTGNSGTSLEYEVEYDGFEVKWPDFKELADEDYI